MRVCVFVCVEYGRALTGLNFEYEGVLLLDGLRQAASGVAFVLILSIFGHDVGEVKITIQTHRYPLILNNWSHRCRRTCEGTQLIPV